MFSNLSQNSILYILDTKGKPKVFSGTINSITPPRPQYATFGLNVVETVVDIIATVDGERREFKRVPSNVSIANFGPDAFVLADSKEAMNSHIAATLLASRNIVNSIDKHKQLIEDYELLLQELDPALKADKEKDKAIQTLLSQVNALQLGMLLMLAIMTKNETSKTEEKL